MGWIRGNVCALVAVVSIGAGCSSLDDDVTKAEQAALGDFLPGLTVTSGLLAEATGAFNAVEQITDGVGPVFNERACGNCHTNGAKGGAGEQIERRFGRFVNGIFDPLAAQGGTLRQLFSVGNFNNPNLPASSRGRCQPGNPTLCCVPVEVEPPQATVHNVGRLTTPVFGGGLIDVIPDSVIRAIPATQPAAIRGQVVNVTTVFPNPGDPAQSLTSVKAGRFGWKAGVSTLLQFSGDAYNNEMAISTQSCFRGTSNNVFALENTPNAFPGTGLEGCDDLAPPQTAPNPGGAPAITDSQWRQVDDAVGSCAGGRTEIQDDIFLFAAFMEALAPAPRDFSDQISVTRGEPLFRQVGCNGCHLQTTFRTPANPPSVDIDGTGAEFVRVPGNFAFNPFSDFLIHDMGSLGDNIGIRPPDDPANPMGVGVVEARSMRTAPLWGLRFRNHLLHDGRCGDVPCAVRAHDGQAAASRNAFNALSPANQHNIVQYVRSL
jgi:CxxC motif-containing protein (DUF1111 family)